MINIQRVETDIAALDKELEPLTLLRREDTFRENDEPLICKHFNRCSIDKQMQSVNGFFSRLADEHEYLKYVQEEALAA